MVGQALRRVWLVGKGKKRKFYNARKILQYKEDNVKLVQKINEMR